MTRRTRGIWFWLLTLTGGSFAILCGGCGVYLWYRTAPAQQLTIGPETTVLDAPLTPDGYVDYASALNQRHSAGVTADQNAVALLVHAFGPHTIPANIRPQYFELLGVPSLPEEGPYFQPLHDFERARNPDQATFTARHQVLLDDLRAAGKSPWTASDFTDIAALLQANEAPLDLIVEASQRPRYYAPLVPDPQAPLLITVQLPVEQQQREAVRQLAARAMLKLGADDVEGAWEDLLTCHRLSRLLGQSWTMISGLVSIAVETVAFATDPQLMGSPSLTADQARRCLADCTSLADLPRMAELMDVGERFGSLDCLNFAAQGRGDILTDAGVDLLSQSKDGDGRSLLNAAVDWNLVLEHVNDYYDSLVAAMNIEDPRQRYAELNRMDEELAEFDPRDHLSLLLVASTTGNREHSSRSMAELALRHLLPAFREGRIAEDRGIARARMVRVGFALAVYRREQGEYPSTLDALAPNILDAVPVDPFTQAPFIYQLTEHGYRIYSVGDNFTDDNGQSYNDNPKGDDNGFEVTGP